MAATCPFGHSPPPSQTNGRVQHEKAMGPEHMCDEVTPARRRIVMLYEEYVHLSSLKQVRVRCFAQLEFSLEFR